MSTSEWTICSWRHDDSRIELVASVKLKSKDRQDVIYSLKFSGDEHQVEIDAKDAKLLIAARSASASSHEDEDEGAS